MRKNVVFSLFFAGLLFAAGTAAAKVEKLSVRSAAMNKDIPVAVVIPDDYAASEKYPVIYLLHGAGGNRDQWLDTKRDLDAIATRDRMIFVCPSVGNSWYWDSPVDPAMRYATFVSGELVKFIDERYSTRADRAGRAITGLSMGGHGAFFLAMTHKDVFGAAGSTSGGVDIRPFPREWDMGKALGDYEANKAVWDAHTVMVVADGLQNGELALIFDCGYSDFFFAVNNALHEKLLAMKIDHDYIVRPGSHNAPYWSNALDYQLLFFRKYFARSNQ